MPSPMSELSTASERVNSCLSAQRRGRGVDVWDNFQPATGSQGHLDLNNSEHMEIIRIASASGKQTWLAGKSPVWVDDFASEPNLHLDCRGFPIAMFDYCRVNKSINEQIRTATVCSNVMVSVRRVTWLIA